MNKKKSSESFLQENQKTSRNKLEAYLKRLNKRLDFQEKEYKYNKILSRADEIFYEGVSDFMSIQYAKRSAFLKYKEDFIKAKNLYDSIITKLLNKECCNPYCIQRAITELSRINMKTSYKFQCVNLVQNKSDNNLCVIFWAKQLNNFQEFKHLAQKITFEYQVGEYNLFTTPDIIQILKNWYALNKEKPISGNAKPSNKYIETRGIFYKYLLSFIINYDKENVIPAFIVDKTTKQKKEDQIIVLSVDISNPELRFKDLQLNFFSIIVNHIGIKNVKKHKENHEFIENILDEKKDRFVQSNSIEWSLIGLFLWDIKNNNYAYYRNHIDEEQEKEKKISFDLYWDDLFDDFKQLVMSLFNINDEDEVYTHPQSALNKTDQIIEFYKPKGYHL